MLSSGTAADNDRPNCEYGLDKVVPVNIRGLGHSIPAPPIENSSETVSTVEEQDKASLLSVTSSIEAAIQLIGNAEAWVDHLHLASTGSYEFRKFVFDSEPGEPAQPPSDANDPNTGPLRKFFLDSEEDEDDEHIPNDDPEWIFCPVMPKISPTAANSIDADDPHEYITDDNSNNREGPGLAVPPITTAAIDAAEHSLLSSFNLPNIPPATPDPETKQLTPSTSSTDETQQERRPSLRAIQDRDSRVSFDLRTPRRSAVRPPGLGAWIAYGAREVVRLVRRVNCAVAAASHSPLVGAGGVVKGRVGGL